MRIRICQRPFKFTQKNFEKAVKGIVAVGAGKPVPWFDFIVECTDAELFKQRMLGLKPEAACHIFADGSFAFYAPKKV